MVVLVVYVTIARADPANTDFDEDKEILKGNAAVGILVAALLLASANIMHNAFAPMLDTVHSYVTRGAGGASRWQIAGYVLANLALGFVIVVGTLSFSLRLFGRLMRTEKSRPGKELERGNVAVGILLSTIVLIVSMFMAEGVQALSRSLIPPTGGRIQIMP